MRLEKIVLDGFKSFGDTTQFTFDSPVTAIVGPNGCGKSNIVDAVKWVLGEQSVKSLRSDQMADVIFGGSSSRKGVGSAEVSLLISDTVGQLPIEAEQVQISRRIYKSGESEYRINNKICRLKDVRELFMDTGVGARAYSIIEQGQVEQLVTASKTDRRIIFEEAAGISKYKAHKKEALRKLEHTEQNLLRVADILGEVAKRLRSVKLAAGKARNYLQYTQRLKELQVNYSLAEFDKNHSESMEKSTSLSRLEEGFSVIAAEVAKNEASISNLGQEIIETENRINRTDNAAVTVASRIEQQLQRIEFLRSRVTELQQRKGAAEDRVGKLHEQEGVFTQELAQYRLELQESEETLEEKTQAIEQIQKAIQQITSECGSLEAELEDEKSGIIDIVRRTAQLHNELQSIGAYRNNLSSQKDRLSNQAEEGRAELEKLLAEKAQYNARLSDIEKVLGELTESLESKRKDAEEINSQIAADNRRLAASREAQSALAGELAVLADMERRREGLGNGVKDILANRSAENDYIEGILADIVAADIKYATAVEAALEGKTDAVVVNSTARLLADTKTLEKPDDRVNFLCVDKIEPFVDKKDLSRFQGVKGRVVEFVNYDSKHAPLVWGLLGKTIIVDSINEAIKSSEELNREYKFVTLAGESYSGDGVIKVGPLGKTTGLISRKSRLRQLQQTIANTTEEIGTLERQIEKNSQANEHLVKLCKELRTAVYEANTGKTEISSKLAVHEQNIQRLGKEQPLIAGEIDLLDAQVSQSVQKEYDSEQRLGELEAVNSQRTAHIKELESRYAEQKLQHQLQTEQLTDLKVAVGQITEHREAVTKTIASVTGQMQANRTAAETALTEIKNSKIEIQNSQRDILNSEAEVSGLFIEKEKRQQDSSVLHEKIEELLEEQKQAEQLVRQKRSEQSEIEQKINQLKIELGQSEVRQQDLVERVRDELQIDLRAAYGDYTAGEVNWDEIREEIGELRGKIERLGNVNVDAIDEQEELEKRHNFLSSQVEDLNSSRSQLQQLIGRLNKQSRERFSRSFEEIRLNFQQVFRKLFGGGKADIVLEEAEDVLEAPIEIVARPPGKETMSISLLSGGEKALTAIALLFAVFKTKPSPFCFLDEIDAALDEANNERFNLLLREFQKDSQFVIITHSKRTMSIADELIGITMQTRGVSKKISVRFDQFDDVEEEAAAVA